MNKEQFEKLMAELTAIRISLIFIQITTGLMLGIMFGVSCHG